MLSYKRSADVPVLNQQNCSNEFDTIQQCHLKAKIAPLRASNGISFSYPNKGFLKALLCLHHHYVLHSNTNFQRQVFYI